MWVRGLKQGIGTHAKQRQLSHPMWVRGLKLQPANEHVGVEQVAPYVGAWIETFLSISKIQATDTSHPMWVRGLKPAHPQRGRVARPVAPYVGAWIETPSLPPHPWHGQVAPYVGAWIETPPRQADRAASTCRTLCGCVD